VSLEAWQIALRREFGRAQRFRLQNIGAEPVFSEFTVSNPQTGGSYRVAIRGRNPCDNYCSCPDFAVNTLGTCKHIEFTLAVLERKRASRAALGAGFIPTTPRSTSAMARSARSHSAPAGAARLQSAASRPATSIRTASSGRRPMSISNPS
jgi:hypothetical protein